MVTPIFTPASGLHVALSQRVTHVSAMPFSCGDAHSVDTLVSVATVEKCDSPDCPQCPNNLHEPASALHLGAMIAALVGCAFLSAPVSFASGVSRREAVASSHETRRGKGGACGRAPGAGRAQAQRQLAQAPCRHPRRRGQRWAAPAGVEPTTSSPVPCSPTTTKDAGLSVSEALCPLSYGANSP
jgi:hypothetical protein